MSADELSPQLTALAGLRQTTGVQKRQSSIIPAPQYYRWERQCDECGRVFAYLDVHLSKSKLCRAAYDIKELRERLKKTNQGAMDVDAKPEGQENNGRTKDGGAQRAAAACADADQSSESEIYEPSEGEESLTREISHQKDQNRDALEEEADEARLIKREAVASTTDQLVAMQQQLRDFHERLNRCEVMSRARGPAQGPGASHDRVQRPSDDDSGFLDSCEPSITLEDLPGSRMAPWQSKHRVKRVRAGVRHQRRLPSVDDCFSDDDDGELEILDENYLLSAQKRTQKTPVVHKAYIQKTACRHCGARIKYILSHLSKSFRCQVAYDMTRLRQQAEDTKRIRQKYYLKHMRRKKKRPEVFEIVEQVGSRVDSRSATSNFNLQRRRGLSLGGHYANFRRKVELDAHGGEGRRRLSNDIEDYYTRLSRSSPQVAPLAGSSSAPRRLFSSACHVTASGPASHGLDSDAGLLVSDYPCFDSDSSHSEDDLEPLEMISAHVVDDSFLSPQCGATASHVVGPASPGGGDQKTHLERDSITSGPASGGTPDHQSITRLKRPANRVIRLTKAGRGGGAGSAAERCTS